MGFLGKAIKVSDGLGIWMNVCMRFREGDLIEDVNGIIFDVKGLVHPPSRVVAFPRFIPDVKGGRMRGNLAYRKIYALSVRYELLEKQFPQYLVQNDVVGEKLCEVPINLIKRHYRPIEKLQELRARKQWDSLERRALDFVSLLKETAGITWDALGVSGSILVNLHTASSDIDPVVYGVENCRRVYSVLKSLFNEEKSGAKPYTKEELQTLFNFRSKDTRMSFEDFVRTESRKVFQGKYFGHDYFVRCIKDWDEVGESYGDVRYSNVGYARVKAMVADASEAIFTPCTYKIGNVEFLEGANVERVSEIVSFRGRFCEQAENGEVVVAQGKLEHMQSKAGWKRFRLLLGSQPSDFMILS